MGWYIWVASNLLALPALVWLVRLATLKFGGALKKLSAHHVSQVSVILAERNLKWSGGLIVATLLLTAADVGMLGVAITKYEQGVDAWIVWGTVAVVVAIAFLLYAVYSDLSLTDRAAQLAEQEKRGGM